MARVVRLLEKIGLVKVDGESAGDMPGGSDETLTPTSLAGEATAVSVPAISLERFKGSAGPGSKEDDISFGDIYDRAGVQAPDHGFTVFKLIEMMSGDEFRGMDSSTMAKVISGMLKRLPSGAVSVDDIVKDAVMRDRALDAFEAFLVRETLKTEQKLNEENIKLQEEIDRVIQANNSAMSKNREKIAQQKKHLADWRLKKEGEEGRLYDALRPFVQTNPITRGAEVPPSRGK